MHGGPLDAHDAKSDSFPTDMAYSPWFLAKLAIVVDHESKQLASKYPPCCVLLLLLQFAGGLQVDPMTFSAEFWAFASATNGPVRLPFEFMPTRRMDKPIESAAVVVKSLSTGKVLPLGINAVLMPNPWMV